MSNQPAGYVTQIGLDALGKKPVVLPDFKNHMMVRVTSLMPTKVAIKMGADMVEKVMDPKQI